MSTPISIPLLVPELPSPQALLPYLERMHAAQHYSNFGPLVKELEQRLLERFASHSSEPLALCTVSSATLGLELALAALNLPPRSRVLIPSLTFVATATAVLRAGHIPVLGDVDGDSWLLTPATARAAATEADIDAVLPVAAFGVPHDMGAWHAFHEETDLPVVVDAAAGYGSQWLDAVSGTAVFSMHATKSLPAGEGGFVISRDPALVSKIQQLSNFGINLNPGASLPVGVLGSVGTNAKMSEYHAAVGLAALDCWAEGADRRRDRHAALRTRLQAVAPPGTIRWQAGIGAVAAPTLLCIRLLDSRQRDRLERICAARGIATRRWYQPLMARMLTVASHCVCLPTPEATSIAYGMCGVPFFPGMTDVQQDALVSALEDALA